ncbi:MAG: hypothetical protein HYX38_21015 [Rhodospirillales bacterium]|nr:hypothetical protein [Rhodospirillales bacterium]
MTEFYPEIGLFHIVAAIASGCLFFVHGLAFFGGLRWAMAARAECVMLNKGPYLFEAIDELHRLHECMEEHQHKKTPQLRRLKSW